MDAAGSNHHAHHRLPSLRAAGLPRRAAPASKLPAVLAFTISSNFEQGRYVQDRILDLIENSGFQGPNFFAIKLALEEAMVNAIKHGNRLDPRKKVHVEARVRPRKVEIRIEDEGPGFKRCQVPDPTADENLERCCGRGILLIESYMNRVKWDRGGRRVTMVKQCTA